MIETYTSSQIKAVDVIGLGANTFITGKPGTGKTEFINDLAIRQKEQGRKVILTATTGIAASCLYGGSTIHSLLKWRINNRDSYDYKKCAEGLREADILVVDEVSMLQDDVLSLLCSCLKTLKNSPQIIMCGDFFQLPPVKAIYYAFESPFWKALELHPCVFSEIVRQKDQEFVAMLEKAMLGDKTCITYFNDMTSKRVIDGAITLCTRNDIADEINKRKLDIIPERSRLFFASGESEGVNYKNHKVSRCLEIKKGMRVMAIINDGAKKYQNGSLGTVLDTEDNYIRVRFDNGNEVNVYRYDFDVDTLSGHPAKISQFPLIGGYAISIHKSQGQTFDSININAPICWDCGQLYVALSRARTVSGIHLANPIKPEDLKVSKKVIEYYKSLQFRRCA